MVVWTKCPSVGQTGQTRETGLTRLRQHLKTERVPRQTVSYILKVRIPIVGQSVFSRTEKLVVCVESQEFIFDHRFLHVISEHGNIEWVSVMTYENEL